MSGIDGNVSNLNRGVFTALKAANNRQLNTTDAQALRTAILKDNVVDENESDLLRELTQDTNRTISVAAQKDSNFTPANLNVPSAQGSVKQSLQALRTHPSELNRLWNGGAEGMKDMVKLYTASPQTKNMVMGFVGRKFQEAWAQSNIANGYGPLRDVIAQAYNTVTSSDPETANNGRTMLHDAAQMFDRFSAGTIPDFLYNWIKPAETNSTQI